MISELRAHLQDIPEQIASFHLLNRYNIHLFSTKIQKKKKPTHSPQPSRHPQPQPSFRSKKASEHPRVQHRISVPANIGRRQLVGLKPGPLQPGASTKGGDGGIS